MSPADFEPASPDDVRRASEGARLPSDLADSMRMRRVPAPAPAAKEAAKPIERPAPAMAAPAPVPAPAPRAEPKPAPKPAPVALVPVDDAPVPRRAARKPASRSSVGVAVVVCILLVAVAGSYLFWEEIWPDADLKQPEVARLVIDPSLSVPTRTTFASPKAGKMRDLGYPVTPANEVAATSGGNLAEHLRRLTHLRETAGKDGLELLSPEDPRPGFGGNGDTPKGPQDSGVAPMTDAEREADTPALPADVETRRQALSPGHYPPSGLEPRQYLVHLRNTLNREKGARLDLEKAYVLLSMYYNPQIDPETHRASFQAMATELYNRLAPRGDDGRRRVVTSGAEQVRIVSEFMMHGLGPFHGWDIQEYHPGLVSHGTPVQDQSYLVHETMANGPHKRNEASSTALNVLTVLLVRKLNTDLTGLEDDPKVYVPLYGVRLPDRTILRYDADGAFKPLPMDEADANAAYAAALMKGEMRTPVEPALGVDPVAYTRNIEFVRNGNHYSARDYVRRMSIPESDIRTGTYLVTLDDKQLFATLGFELARKEVLSRTAQGYERAQTLLEEWVLDRDDGSGQRWDGTQRPRPASSAPRGDPNLRDAYLLYADMLLQQADYEGIKRQIDSNIVLRENRDRLNEIRGMIAHQRARLESAQAYLEDALRLSPENARAHLYMGDIDFVMDDGSTPDSMRGSDADRLGRALNHFNRAEFLDKGTLNGQERFLLHYHRALANKRRGNLVPSLADLDRVAEINPAFARTPAFEKTRDRLRMDRAFEVLKATSGEREDAGEQKFDAVRYLEANLTLDADHRADLMQCAACVGALDNLAAEWELVRFLQRLTGQDMGRDSAAWTKYLKLHLDQLGPA